MAGGQTRIPGGRLRRLGKLAGLTARVGTDLVAGRARQLLGAEGEPRLESARRVLATLGELKGAALKVGQLLSLASDQLPPEVRQVVSQLFHKAPTLPYPAIAEAVEQELGAPPEKLFASFDKEPFAGASLGQVHRARLADGRPVAVKVQYPGVDGALEDDLKNAEVVVRALGVGGSLLDGREYFEELRREVSAELDYRRELERVEEFRAKLSRWPDLVVPAAVPELTTRRVLVLEELEGPTLAELAQQVDSLPAERRFALGERLVRAVYGPFFFHKVIHADVHPGNFVVLPGDRLGVLDFGSVKRLSDPFWRIYLTAMAAGMEGRPIDLLPLVREGGFQVNLPDDRGRELLNAICHVVGAPVVAAHDFSKDSMIQQLYALKRTHALDLLRIRPPPEALLFYRAMGGLSHNLRALKASGDFRPFLRQSLRELGMV